MDLATLLPAGGIAGTLAVVIIYLLNSNRLDRAQHREERQELRDALTRMREEHSAELSELRKRVDDLEAEVDVERRARVAAEQVAAANLLRAERAEYRLAYLHPSEADGGTA